MPSSVYLHDGEKQITVRFSTEEDRERFKAHYRKLDALAVQFRDERDALRERVARLTAALEWVRNAGREARDGAMSDGMGVIAMLDFAEFGLSSMEATLPALPDDRDATITALREQIAGLAAALTDAAECLWEMGDNNALARRLDALGAGGEVVRHEETP